MTVIVTVREVMERGDVDVTKREIDLVGTKEKSLVLMKMRMVR